MECDQVRDLVPELALGIADGAERAAALRHLARCPDCRRMLEELSAVTDELLLLAPEHDPPPGFESRVLERMQPPRVRERRLRRHRTLFTSVAAGLAAAAATAAIFVNATSDDRRIAAQYRSTLATAHGAYFEAATLRDPAGGRAGVVFGYRGSPSWIFCELDQAYRTRGYAPELVLTSGRRLPLRALAIDATRGSAGRAIPVDLHDVAVVRFVGRAPGDVLQATLPHKQADGG
jgi:RimJ/RimL family protein N-acetyltransferase